MRKTVVALVVTVWILGCGSGGAEKQRRMLNVGDDVVLQMKPMVYDDPLEKGKQRVATDTLVFPTETAMRNAFSDGVFHVPRNTRAVVAKINGDHVFVTIMDGEHKGDSGWVELNEVKAAPAN